MQTQFTKEFMATNCGCYSQEQLNNTSFMKLEVITLDSILDSEIPLKDKYWFCCKKLFTKEQNQQIAIGAAEIVLEIYEIKYPNNKSLREAIQAAKDYLNNTEITLQELRKKRNAATAAAADAAAADAAAAAYYAAAAAASDAAADAADTAAAAAVTAAAYAAYYAADTAVTAAAYYATAASAATDTRTTKDFNNLLLSFLKEFTNNNNNNQNNI